MTLSFQTLIFMLFSISAFAEYRAFNLKITDTSNNQERFIQSNLDPIQYQGYNSLKPTEIITYTESWMCPGRTGDFMKICDNPAVNQKPESERLPASDKTSLNPESSTKP